ncbi:hypothetical protein [Thauera phenylacetica]
MNTMNIGGYEAVITFDPDIQMQALGSGLSFAHPVSRGPGVVCRL